MGQVLFLFSFAADLWWPKRFSRDLEVCPTYILAIQRQGQEITTTSNRGTKIPKELSVTLMLDLLARRQKGRGRKGKRGRGWGPRVIVHQILQRSNLIYRTPDFKLCSVLVHFVKLTVSTYRCILCHVWLANSNELCH